MQGRELLDIADKDWLENLDKENLDENDPLSLKRAIKSMKDSIKESTFPENSHKRRINYHNYRVI